MVVVIFYEKELLHCSEFTGLSPLTASILFIFYLPHLVTEYENLKEDDADCEEGDGDHGDGDPHVIQEHLEMIT